MAWWAWVLVPPLGAGAALTRFAVEQLASKRRSTGLPLGTIAVNISGALLLGLLAGLSLDGDTLLLAGSATIGSYTTFSAWMLQTHLLRRDGRPGPAVANLLISATLGLGAVALGRTLGTHF